MGKIKTLSLTQNRGACVINQNVLNTSLVTSNNKLQKTRNEIRKD